MNEFIPPAGVVLCHLLPLCVISRASLRKLSPLVRHTAGGEEAAARVDEEDKITKEDRKRNNLFYLLKDSIVGGPSIIFNRYHEANKTKIRDGDKFCKKIIGYDANALYLWAIAQEMPTGKHEHITNYDLNQLNQDILNDNLFGFIKVDIETPEHLKEKFSEMTPIFKNATIKFEDIGEYMQNFHTENNIKFNQGNKLIGSYFGKEIVLYSPLLKWYLQEGLIITKFHCAIQYKPEYSFNKFADEVSDARRAGDVDTAYELIAETMKLFGNSAYGKTITNKENLFQLLMVMKIIFLKRSIAHILKI